MAHPREEQDPHLYGYWDSTMQMTNLTRDSYQSLMEKMKKDEILTGNKRVFFIPYQYQEEKKDD